MSEMSWTQARHTLLQIEQQKPTHLVIKQLHDGPLSDLVEALVKRGGLPSREKVREFYGLEPLQTETVKDPLAPAVAAHTDILKVDYSQTFVEQMIAAGHYGENGDNWNKDITAKRFPIVGTGTAEFEFKVFDFGRGISSESAVEAIKADDKANPWEPAKTEHTLAYGSQFPEEQRRNPIVGLGSVGEVGDCRFVLALFVDGGRHLGLRRWVGDWNAGYRFLAVRKIPKLSVS